MAKNKIEESQQQSQGVTLGTQGNQDITIPQGTKGPQRKNENADDRHIPNQDRSSARNKEDAEVERGHS
jgi:hypothetical protein